MELVRAFKKIDTERSIKLLIVGSQWYSHLKMDDYMKKIEDELGTLKGQVIFTGYIQANDMPSIYKTMDVLVVPTMNEEPFGCVVIEGMAMGKPLVVTKSGAIPEIIKNDFGFVIGKETELIDNMSDAIKKLIEDDELRKKFGQNARKEFEQKKAYHKDQYYRNFIKIINTN